jgi:hypothetical protein
MKRTLGLVLGVSAVFLSGCNSGVEPPSGDAVQEAAPQVSAVAPAVSINAVMVALVDHASHVIWDAAVEGKTPKSDRDWREIEHHAIQITSSGPLIALGGTGQADRGWAQQQPWRTYAQALTDAGVAALEAARSRNQQSLAKAGDQLVEACTTCHKEYKPELPTEGIVHPHDEQPAK